MNLPIPPKVFTLFVALFVLGSASADDIRPFEAQFIISNGEYSVGKATLSLKPDNEHWSMRLATEPTGVFKLMARGYTTETSTLAATTGDSSQQGRLLPVRYSYHQKKGKPKRNLSAEFLHSAGVVSVLTEDGNESVIETGDSVHDPLSSMLETMRVLRGGSVDEIVLQVFSRGEIKQHKLQIGDVETVKTTLGAYPAIRVTRTHSGSARETRIWYAKSLDYAPVQIEQHKRGELVARLLLDSIK